MKILIIGSAGFIGSHCVDYFGAKGHEIIALKYIADFNVVFQNQNFDACINASGSANVGLSFENPAKDFELNVANVHKMLIAIRQYNPTCKFINFSSAAVYGNPVTLPIAETTATNPLSPYGFHKLQSEYLLTEYHKFFGLHTCNLRVFSAYGSRLSKQLFWDLYQKTLRTTNKDDNENIEIEIFGTGEETRDFIFIVDLLQAIDLVLQHGKFQGDVINVASGKETKIKEAVSTFLTLLNPKIIPIFTGKQKIGDPNNWRSDITILQNMGFIPKIALRQGLENYTTWLKTVVEKK